MAKVILFWVMTTFSGTNAGSTEFQTVEQCETAKQMVLSHAEALNGITRVGYVIDAKCI